VNPELKAEWVAALRGGEYEQGQGCLHSEDGAKCCLGVLCDVMGKKWKKELFGWKKVVAGYKGGNYKFPPRGVTKEAGLSESDCEQLTRRNDGLCGFHQHSFPEMADYIEANL
jgi:hypothetical protein